MTKKQLKQIILETLRETKRPVNRKTLRENETIPSQTVDVAARKLHGLFIKKYDLKDLGKKLLTLANETNGGHEKFNTMLVAAQKLILNTIKDDLQSHSNSDYMD